MRAPVRPRRLSAALRVAVVLVGAAGLAACGGGSGDAPAAAAQATESAGAAAPLGPAPAPAPAAAPAAAPASASLPVAGAGGTVSAGAGCALTYTLTASPLLAGADPLFARQWHLSNTGQNGGTAGEDLRVLGAWSTTRGAGVRVAVIDDAVEVTHPDLRPNHVDGQSLSYRAGNRGSPWPLPCTDAEGHGTAVAGLIVARDDNAIGGAGVAPRSAFVAFDALSSGAEADIVAALTRAGEVNAIYHNSWGSPDDGALHAAPAAFDAAIGSGLASGRGGLGSVYVFSAGNGGCYGRGANGACLRDDANYDGFLTGLGTVVVCAVDDAGRQPFYGEQGANLTVCAPSSGSKRVSLTTTALQGAWRDDFTGTSGSAPQVSGVVALMLATNPQLTWRDVRLILAGTARQNDPSEPGWTTGYGYRFNHKYGFGVVDAQAAVAAAAGWSSVGGSGTLKTCGPYTRSPGRALPDAVAGAVTPVTDAIAVAGCDITRIEWVQVRLTAPHPYAGDLRVRLTSPNGLVSRLADGRACASPSTCGSYADWRFGSMRHLGEPAAGTWTLELADTAAQDVGTFQAWSITLYGR